MRRASETALPARPPTTLSHLQIVSHQIDGTALSRRPLPGGHLNLYLPLWLGLHAELSGAVNGVVRLGRFCLQTLRSCANCLVPCAKSILKASAALIGRDGEATKENGAINGVSRYAA